jgi:hypothetical protein
VIARFLPWGSHGGLNYAHAPLWFPGSLTGWAFGLAGPDQDQLATVADAVVGMPQLCLVLAAYALSYVIAVVRPDRTVVAEVSPVAALPAPASSAARFSS